MSVSDVDIDRCEPLLSMLRATVRGCKTSAADLCDDAAAEPLFEGGERDARAALTDFSQNPDEFSVAAWAETVLTIRRMRDRGLPCEPTSIRRKTFDLVERAERKGPPAGIEREAFQAATERLLSRVGTATGTSEVLHRCRPHWIAAPSASLVEAPVLMVDHVELAVAAILSMTQPDWQFSITTRGRAFLGRYHGYHKDDGKRRYVDGLSEVVDASSAMVDSHRAGQGGRIFVKADHVECANCNLVLMWLNEAGEGRRAFRLCGGLSRK